MYLQNESDEYNMNILKEKNMAKSDYYLLKGGYSRESVVWYHTVIMNMKKDDAICLMHQAESQIRKYKKDLEVDIPAEIESTKKTIKEYKKLIEGYIARGKGNDSLVDTLQKAIENANKKLEVDIPEEKKVC